MTSLPYSQPPTAEAVGCNARVADLEEGSSRTPTPGTRLPLRLSWMSHARFTYSSKLRVNNSLLPGGL